MYNVAYLDIKKYFDLNTTFFKYELREQVLINILRSTKEWGQQRILWLQHDDAKSYVCLNDPTNFWKWIMELYIEEIQAYYHMQFKVCLSSSSVICHISVLYGCLNQRSGIWWC